VPLLDTGYFIALLNQRDELHRRAVAWSRAISDKPLVTEYVLWETVNFFSMPLDRPKVHALVILVRSSQDYEFVPATTTLLDVGLELHAKSADKEWSLTDCIPFVVMRERGIRKALTHDKHFEQAGFEALLRRDPPG